MRTSLCGQFALCGVSWVITILLVFLGLWNQGFGLGLFCIDTTADPAQRDQVRHAPSASMLCFHRQCQQRSRLYEKVREEHPRRWSRSAHCWRQKELVWINIPTEAPETTSDLSLTKTI
jgi:hypothetical protein